jgi:hypothetical protein
MSPTNRSIMSRDTVDLRLRNMTSLAKPVVSISLNNANSNGNEYANYVCSYSTMDKIEGVVTVTAKHDTKFDDVEITLTGKFVFCQSPSQCFEPSCMCKSATSKSGTRASIMQAAHRRP